MSAGALTPAEAVSLERFRAREKRIEALVGQLESLAPTELRAALDPLPPARSPVSRGQWERWVAEQRALELEAEEFDTVDLQRWKTLAKGPSAASQRARTDACRGYKSSDGARGHGPGRGRTEHGAGVRSALAPAPPASTVAGPLQAAPLVRQTATPPG